MKETDPYKNILRVRSCGVLIEDQHVLLVKLLSPVTDSLIWTAPGGGVQAGETLRAAAEREFLEETGVEVRAGKLLLIHELNEPPYQAIEFFFAVEKTGGKLQKGTDPELKTDKQIITEVSLIPFSELVACDIQPAALKNLLVNIPERLKEPAIHLQEE